MAATRIFRGDESRRRRGHDVVDSPRSTSRRPQAIYIDPLTLTSLVADALAKMLVTAVVGVDSIANSVAAATRGLPALIPDPDERAALQHCYDVRGDDAPAPAAALGGSSVRVVPEEAVPEEAVPEEAVAV